MFRLADSPALSLRYRLDSGCWANAGRLADRKPPERGNWYRKLETRHGEHPVTSAAERRVKRGAGAARWRAILALSRRLAERAPEDLRADWLALEELLHAHGLALAAAHYNLGVEDGLRQRLVKGAAPDELPLGDQIRALVDALSKTVSRL